MTIQVPSSRGSEELTDLALWNIVLLVAVSSIAAGILLWLLQRLFAERALRIFQVIAMIALTLSLILPFGVDQPLEAQLALTTMHILVGMVIIGTMTWVATKPTVSAGDLG